jgi:hypothetical protein
MEKEDKPVEQKQVEEIQAEVWENKDLSPKKDKNKALETPLLLRSYI